MGTDSIQFATSHIEHDGDKTCYTDIQVLKHIQNFVIIVCAPNLQHAKHTVTFCFSLKMALGCGREVSCVCSFTKLTL